MPNCKHPVLFSEEQLRKRCQELGQEITTFYSSSNYKQPTEGLFVLVVLKGSFIFAADLVRYIDLPTKIDFLTAKSYKGTQSSGDLQLFLPPNIVEFVKEKNVLLIEDILDTGSTMRTLKATLEKMNPRSIKLACLLSKPDKHATSEEADFIGFKITNEFVIGYGLDLDEDYRSLRSIHQIKDN